MNYSLGNMLVNGGSLNADGLSLDLQFAADKSLTARKGPTPVFTRASTATFIDSDGLIQSAAINAARFDHDPITLACKGLLIEESRTNNFTRSDDFAQSVWTKNNVTVTSDNVTSPNGGSDADSFFETATVGEHLTFFAASSLTDATLSVFVKANGRSNINLRLIFATGNWITTTFLLSGSGSVTQTATGLSSTYTSRSQTITQLSNGWYRCTLSAVRSGGVGNGSFDLCTGSTPTLGVFGTESYLGNTSLGLHLWGAQLEAGAFPTSYIPTVAASVVRSVDVCSITGSDFTGMYNASEGTMLVNAFTPANGDRTVFAADDNTANEMIRLRTEGTNPFFKVTDGGSDLVAIDAGTVVANTPFKLAGAYKLNDFASSINGGAAVTDTSGTIPTVDRMRIGAGQAGNTMCGCIVSARYFKKRLANAKLTTITT
jgi:hypothetical protein